MARRGRPPKVVAPAEGVGRAAGGLVHGILSTRPVLAEAERDEDWQAHYDGFIDSLKPVGHAEAVLVYRIALGTWRLNRIIAHELSVFLPSERTREAIEKVRAHHEDDPGFVFYRPFPPYSHHTVETLARYEAHLHRMFIKDLHELEAMQSKRTGQPSPSPLARLDVTE